jgi:four helix bundle protein
MGRDDRANLRSRKARCVPAVDRDVAASYENAKALRGPNRHIRNQWLRAAQSIPLNIAEGNGKQNLKDKNRYFQIARGSALECAAVHDILVAFAVLDEDANRQGKSYLKRIVSMWTRLIPRSDSMPPNAIEYEYRDAEYE